MESNSEREQLLESEPQRLLEPKPERLLESELEPESEPLLEWTWVHTWKGKVQFLFNVLFLVLVMFGLIAVILLRLMPETQERRCKCVCPHNINVTDWYNQTVFQKEIQNEKQCDCHNVVPDATDNICLQCNCVFEERNKLLIKSVNVGVIMATSFLSLYAFAVMIAQCALWVRGNKHRCKDSIYEVDMRYVDNQTAINSRRRGRRSSYNTF